MSFVASSKCASFVACFFIWCAVYPCDANSQTIAPNWRERTPSAPSFTNRRGHCSVALKNRQTILVIGGYDAEDQLLSDPYEQVTTSDWWRQVPGTRVHGTTTTTMTTANQHQTLMHHCIVIDGHLAFLSETREVLFQSVQSLCSDDTIIFVSGVSVFSFVVPVANNLFSPRALFACCVVSSSQSNQADRVIIHGGISAAGASSTSFLLSVGSDNSLTGTSRETNIHRAEHAGDVVGGFVVVFGGINELGEIMDSTIRMPISDNAAPAAEEINVVRRPEARAGHTAVASGESLYIFGGYTGAKQTLGDAWVLSLSTDSSASPQWDVLQSSVRPTARCYHAAIVIGSLMVVHGGIMDLEATNYAVGIQVAADTWGFDFVLGEWSLLAGEVASPRMAQHGLVDMEMSARALGGQSATATASSTVTVFDTTLGTWQAQAAAGRLPEPRYGHVLESVGLDVVLHGGLDGVGKYLGDTWVWRADSLSFDFAVPADGAMTPSARAFHASSVFGNHLLIFGGQTTRDRSLLDLWQFHPPSRLWKQHTPTGVWPSLSVAGAMHVIGKWLFTIGGRGSNTDALMFQRELNLPSPVSDRYSGDSMLVMDGLNDVMMVPSLTPVAFDMVAFEAWVAVRDFNVPWQVVWEKGDAVLSRCSKNANLCWETRGASDFQLRGNANVFDGNWHHISVSYDQVTKFIYVDGQIDASIASTGPMETTAGWPLTFGAGSAVGKTTFFNGFVDDVRFWSTGRTLAQVQSTMWERPIAVGDASSGLLAAWSFDGAITDGRIADISGNQHSGILGNSSILTQPLRAASSVAGLTAGSSHSIIDFVSPFKRVVSTGDVPTTEIQNFASMALEHNQILVMIGRADSDPHVAGIVYSIDITVPDQPVWTRLDAAFGSFAHALDLGLSGVPYEGQGVVFGRVANEPVIISLSANRNRRVRLASTGLAAVTHSAITRTDGGVVYAFGGNLPSSTPINALYSRDTLDDDASFTTVKPPGVRPPGIFKPILLPWKDTHYALVNGWGTSGPIDGVWLLEATSGVWTEVNDLQNGFARGEDYVVAYHGKIAENQHTIVAFGGESLSGFHNDMHMLDLSQRKWTLVTPQSDLVPSKRCEGVAGALNDKMYVWGGLESYFSAVNDFYVFNFATMKWSALSTTNGPPPLWEGIMQVIPERQQIIVGLGQGDGTVTTRTNELWVYSIVDDSWVPVLAANARPSRRRQPAWTMLGSLLLLFGGRVAGAGGLGGGDDNEMWMIDTSPLNIDAWEWKRIEAAGAPWKRGHAQLVPFDGGVLLYGGVSDVPVYEYMSDLHVFEYENADPRRTSASGLGLQSATVGETANFVINPLNVLGRPQALQFCADNFQADFVGRSNSVRFGGQITGVRATTGCEYRVSYKPFVSGRYQLTIIVSDVVIPGSPFEVEVKPTKTSAPFSVVHGDGLTTITVGQVGTFTLQARDRFGNSAASGDAVHAVLVEGGLDASGARRNSYTAGTHIANVLDRLDGTYEVTYSLSRAGHYSLSLTINRLHVPGSPFNTTVLPEVPGSPAIVIARTESTTAGSSGELLVQSIDSMGNNVTFGIGSPKVYTQFRTEAGMDVPNTDVKPRAIDNEDGTYAISIYPFVAGTYSFDVRINDVPVEGSPFGFVVLPASQDSGAQRSRSIAIIVSCFTIAVLAGVVIRLAQLWFEKKAESDRGGESVRDLAMADVSEAIKRSETEAERPNSGSGVSADANVDAGKPSVDTLTPPIDGEEAPVPGSGDRIWRVALCLRQLNDLEDRPKGYRELAFFLIFFLLYIGVQAMQIDPTRTYNVNSSIRSLVQGSSDVVTVDHLWGFIDSLLSLLFDDKWYNGATKTVEQLGYVALYNKVIGGVLVVQSRAQAEECRLSSVYNPFYGPCHSGESDVAFGESQQHVYNSDHGGHSQFFSVAKSLPEVQADLLALQQDLWLDRATQSVVIKFATYNGEAQLFSMAFLQFDIGVGGTVLSSNIDVQSAKLELFLSPLDWLRTALELLLILVSFYSVMDEGIDFYETVSEGGLKAYFDSIWNYLDIATLGLLMGYIFLRLSYVIYIVSNPMALPSTRYEPVVEVSSEKLRTLLAINVLFIFVSVLRLFKFFEFQPRMNIISRTVSNAAIDMAHFFILFVLIFMSFCVMGLLLFGPHVQGFSSIGVVTQSMGEMMLFNFEYSNIADVDPFMAALLTWSYLLVVSFILISIFLAILIDAYADARVESLENGGASVASDLVQWARRSASPEHSDALISAVQFYSTKGIPAISAADIDWHLRNVAKLDDKSARRQLTIFESLPGFESVETNPESMGITVEQLARSAWAQFDADGNGVLSKEEFREFLRCCKVQVADEDDVELLIARADTNGDGVIGFDEFIRLFNQLMFDDMRGTAKYGGRKHRRGGGGAGLQHTPSIRPQSESPIVTSMPAPQPHPVLPLQPQSLETMDNGISTTLPPLSPSSNNVSAAAGIFDQQQPQLHTAEQRSARHKMAAGPKPSPNKTRSDGHILPLVASNGNINGNAVAADQHSSSNSSSEVEHLQHRHVASPHNDLVHDASDPQAPVSVEESGVASVLC